MKTIHDWYWHIKYLSGKRVVAWLDDREVFCSFPVAFLTNADYNFYLIRDVTEHRAMK